MPAKKKPAVTTPLQLLEQLSGDLLKYFEKACGKALDEAEGLLAELEKERARSQDKLHKAQEKRAAAVEAGKPKAQAKAEARIAELDTLLAQLQVRQQQLLTYLAQLRRDSDRGLQLAKGIREVELSARAAQQPAPEELAKKAPRRTSQPVARAAAAGAPRVARPRPAAAKPAAPAAAKPKAASKPAASKPAPRRPAAKKTPPTQPSE